MIKEYGMAVISLGVVGRRMIEQAALHGGFRIVAALDASPAAAETASVAVLDCAGVPVAISGSVGGQPPDVVEARFIGAQRELRLVDWFRLLESGPDGSLAPVAGLPQDRRGAAFQAQLAQLHAMLSGGAHTLPDFAAALAVQRIVESILEGARP